MRQLTDEPALAEAYGDWQPSRDGFTKRLRSGEPDAVKKGWQRGYIRGTNGAARTPFHVSKRNLNEPQ